MNREDMEKSRKSYIKKMKNEEKAKHTINHYDHVLDVFIAAMPEKSIQKDDVIDFKQKLLDQQMKPSTINNYVSIINKFLKYMHKKAYTVKYVKVQKKASLDEVLEPADLKRLLRTAKKLGKMDYYMIMQIFAYTGIRVKELEYFTVENIQKNYIMVRNKGKIRNIILRNDLKKELNRYCKENNITTGYLFPGRKQGTMICESTIWKNLKKIAGYARGVSLEKVHAHSFRHLFAIHYLQQGGNLADLADILGHGSIKTTQIYARTTDKMKKQQIEKMKY